MSITLDVRQVSIIHTYIHTCCFDAQSDSALRVSCRLLAPGPREQLARLPLPLRFSGAGRIAVCGSRPARSRPATRIAQAWRASATNTDNVPDRRSAARPLTLRRAAGPGARSLGQGPTVTASPTPTRTPPRARQARLAVGGQAARVGCWTGRGGRRAWTRAPAAEFQYVARPAAASGGCPEPPRVLTRASRAGEYSLATHSVLL